MISKVYIASSSAFIDECKDLASRLESKGVTITRKWWEEYVKGTTPELDKLTDQDWYAHPRIIKIREADFEAVREAEVVIIVSHYPKALTGALIELGYALALKKPVIILGEMKKSAMVSSCLFAKDQEELLKLLVSCKTCAWGDGNVKDLGYEPECCDECYNIETGEYQNWESHEKYVSEHNLPDLIKKEEEQRLKIQELEERNTTLANIIGNFPSHLEIEELSEEEEKTVHKEWLKIGKETSEREEEQNKITVSINVPSKSILDSSMTKRANMPKLTEFPGNIKEHEENRGMDICKWCGFIPDHCICQKEEI